MIETKAIIGKEYKHYKGGIYKVTNIATHTETEEILVIYKEIESNKVWARPRDMFEDTVEIDGEIINRFSQLD
ncbi:DUF1653 domain-containing protein [Wukongibacter sp. M2B1]|uniref:DUF1653 domain-containing protein n=1 Tax=Wukongibacter sp. M2B1 TaxID=3088895 RepID=UPI003D7B4E71